MLNLTNNTVFFFISYVLGSSESLTESVVLFDFESASTDSPEFRIIEDTNMFISPDEDDDITDLGDLRDRRELKKMVSNRIRFEYGGCEPESDAPENVLRKSWYKKHSYDALLEFQGDLENIREDDINPDWDRDTLREHYPALNLVNFQKVNSAGGVLIPSNVVEVATVASIEMLEYLDKVDSGEIEHTPEVAKPKRPRKQDRMDVLESKFDMLLQKLGIPA